MFINRNLNLAALALFTLVLTACPTSPEPGGKMPPQAEAVLQPGEVVVGIDGVSLGATLGALEEDIGVSIERVGDESSLPPLGDDHEHVGAMYVVRSDTRFVTPITSPLIVGLPLPAGRARDTLELAVLSIGLGHDPGDGEAIPDTAWASAEGMYDEASGLFLTPLYSLSEPGEGVVLTVIDSGEPATQVRASALSVQAEVIGRFAGKCSIKFSAGDCTDEEEEDAARVADDFYRDMVTTLGFKKPLIRPLLADVKVTLNPPSFSASVDVARHLIDLQLDDELGCRDFPARYVLPLLKVYICLPAEARNNIITVPSPTDPSIEFPGHEQTIHHEVFHAIQWNYGGVTSAGLSRNVFWPLVEGGANTAELSRTEMRTNGSNDRHPVDASLSRKAFRVGVEENDYNSQDFWVFVGRQNNVGIDYFQSLYSGPTLTNASVDQAFKLLFGDSYGLAEAYWDWVKNQAFESRVAEGDLGVNEPCLLNDAVVSETIPRVTYDPINDQIIGYNDFVTELEPLSARVYELVLEPVRDGYFAKVGVNIDNPNVKVKFYENYSSSTTACQNEPDSRSYVTPVERNEGQIPKSIYMLVANTGFSHTPTLFTNPNDELFFEVVQPAITIIEPKDTAAFPEGEIVSFRAELENPLGVGATVRWLVDGEDAGVPGGETFGASFCPGDHTVTAVAEFRDKGASATVTDSVVITAVNNAPRVQILEAPENVGVNNEFALSGSVTDPTCTDTRGTVEVDLARLVWTLEDGFGGIGPGILSSFTQQGEKTVSLSYTDESGTTATDTLIVSVSTFDPDAGPVLVIEEPQEGAFIDLANRSGSDYVIGVVGKASASVSDSNLVWSYQAAGTMTWQDFATGRSATLRLPVPINSDKAYTLRLKIRDKGVKSERAVMLRAIVQ